MVAIAEDILRTSMIIVCNVPSWMTEEAQHCYGSVSPAGLPLSSSSLQPVSVIFGLRSVVSGARLSLSASAKIRLKIASQHHRRASWSPSCTTSINHHHEARSRPKGQCRQQPNYLEFRVHPDFR